MRAPLYDPGAAACAVLPSAFLRASASHVRFSGLDHAARMLAVYASPPRLPASLQDSLLAVPLGLGEVTSSVTGLQMRFSSSRSPPQ
jgi:hypothetical protein